MDRIDDTRAERLLLRSLIEEVTAADGRRYGATDDGGRPMHCAKIVEDPGGSSPYLAVYHHGGPGDGRFHVSLAASSDLLSWEHVRDFGAGGSQPTLFAVPDGGFLVAWEQDPRNHIELRYYATRDALFGGPALRRFRSRRSLSRCAEGTPNIYSVRLEPDIDHSLVTVGGHYWWRCDRDRQLRATLTDFRRWRAAPEPEVEAALLRWGVGGNIGGRDPVTFLGYPYAVIEGQYVKGDFGSWRTFLYDYAAGFAEPVAIHTDRGSTAFANPHITALTAPDGRRAVVVTLFIPGEGMAPGEGGEAIYWRAY
jgi:hypothetical protein